MEMRPIQSSNIKAAGYENGVIRVQFSNGAEYDYKADAKTYADFMAAKSQGKFFNQNIRSVNGTKVQTGD